MKQPENLTVAQIFVNRVRYCVPMFQRHYVWTEEKQWEPLWQDIVSKANERINDSPKTFPHFMGAIIYEGEGGYTTKKVQVCKVIDGQQRLTTLQIFLAALRDVATSKGLNEIAEDTEQYLFNANPNLMTEQKVEIYKVWPTRFDRDVFSDMISLKSLNEIVRKYKEHFPTGKQRLRRDKTKDIPLLLKAYMYFHEQIREFLKSEADEGEAPLTPAERLDALYRAFLEGFRIVAIPLDAGEDDPQVIFETLNDRGTPLLASDLIRNYIFYRAEAEIKNPVALYEESWSEFEKEFWSVEIRQGRLNRSRLEFFMQHFIAAKTGHEINLIKLFQEYKAFIQGDRPYETIKEELADIAKYSPIYSTLVAPQDDSHLAKFARALQPWDVSTVFPLVLQIMGSGLPDKEKHGMLDDILSYIVRRSICQKTPKNYNKFFLQVVRHLQKQTNGITRKALQDYLLAQKKDTAIWPLDSEFESAWLNKPAFAYLTPNRISYVLKEIESGLKNKFSEEVEIRSFLTVEHIMPQSWYEHWPLQDGQKVSQADAIRASQKIYEHQFLIDIGLDDEIRQGGTKEDTINFRERLIHTFGNLTLLTTQLNSSVGKNPFEKRRKAILEQSSLALNRYFQNVDSWDEDQISARGAAMFKIAESIWSHPGRAEEKEEAA